MRRIPLFVGLLLLMGAPAQAATISVARTNNSTCLHSENNNSGTQEAWNAGGCSNPGTVFGEAQAFSMSDTGNATSVDVAHPGDFKKVDLRTFGNTTTVAFDINAGLSTDDVGGDSFIRGQVRYDLTITINTDYTTDFWEVDLDQSVLGLLALRGDGTASAVGTQDNGEAQISSITVTATGGLVNIGSLNYGVANSSLINNPSNGGSSSQQFSGSRSDQNIASGTGSGSFNISIAYDLDGFSNDGCSGTVCSSITGGEEVGVLNGFDNADGVGNPSADQYGVWGRSQGPDGNNNLFTLVVPEPGTAVLVALGLAGLGYVSRKRQ